MLRRHPFSTVNYRAGKEPGPLLSDEYLKTVTQSRAILDNPPIETSPTVQSEAAQLTFTAPLSIGVSRGPQVVTCSVTRQMKTKDAARPVQHSMPLQKTSIDCSTTDSAGVLAIIHEIVHQPAFIDDQRSRRAINNLELNLNTFDVLMLSAAAAAAAILG